jgi:hypothetical protein
MKGKNAVMKKQAQERSEISQTVTSPVERREIRQFINMRLDQMKARLDRIYRFNKDRFVEDSYEKKATVLTGKPKLVEILKSYNGDNQLIRSLMAQREQLNKRLERLCDKKQRASEKLADYCMKINGLAHNESRYGDLIERHADKAIDAKKLVEEAGIKEQLKQDFDAENSEPMEQRNRKLQYLREKIEERLLFGKRDEIHKLFCELEKINAAVEKELIGLGIDEGIGGG